MMKKLFVLVYFILFSCLNAISQTTFEKIIPGESDEIITGLGTTSTGEYIISSCQATADTSAPLQYTGNLLKVDMEGNLLQRLVFNTSGCFSHLAGLYRDENGIFIYVTFEKRRCRMDTAYMLSLRQFDENLNLISSDSIAYSFMYRYDMTYFRIIRMPDGGINIWGDYPTDQGRNPIIFQYGSDGHLLHIKPLEYPHGVNFVSLIPNKDPGFLYSCIAFAGSINFDFVTCTDNYDYLNAGQVFLNYFPPISLKEQDGYYYITGYRHFTADTKYQVACARITPDHTCDNQIIFGKEGLINDEPANIQAVDFTDTTSVYIGGSTNIYYPDHHNASSWFMLNKTDGSLNSQWMKYYGGDAHYEMYNVAACSDGGCLMAGTRYSLDDPAHKRNIYLLKVNDQGIPTGIKEPGQAVKGVSSLVFPNPGNGQLTVFTSLKDATFGLSNTNGQTVVSQPVNNGTTTVNTSALPAGVYLYRFMNKEKIVESGKWVKE